MRLSLYLGRTVAVHILAVLLALTALVQMIEMVEAIQRIFGTANAGVGALVHFLVMNTPVVAERVFPLAVLIGSALGFHTLAHRNEMIVLRASGLSPYQFLKALTPMLALFCGAYFLLIDRLAPDFEHDLALWWEQVDPQPPAEDGDRKRVWLRVGSEIVSVGRILDQGRRLEDVTRYRRDETGRLTEVERAVAAVHGSGGWALEQDVVTRNMGGGMVTQRAAKRSWKGGPSVENMRDMTLPTERVSIDQARQVLAGTWSGTEGAAHYRVALNRNYSALVLPFVMALLAMPALRGERRAGNLARGLTASLLLGVVFTVVNGLFLSMGQSAALPAILAVWAAPVAFIGFGLGILLHLEE